MATRAANKRLTHEYKAMQENPPPYIQAHPSECNILEWHYIITGPEKTPYENGQYWGTLIFPPDYPFKPPAIRMMTPSGRFQTSTRLCLSISDFHPRSFNPAWEVSTILIGLLSFMTSEEMTTGSISATESERKILAARSRWWNSTGGGSGIRNEKGVVVPNIRGNGNSSNGAHSGGTGVGWGDQGKKFRSQFPEVDEQNWTWMKDHRINPSTGVIMAIPSSDPSSPSSSSSSTTSANYTNSSSNTRRRDSHQRIAVGSGGAGGAASVVVRGGESWARRHKVLLGVVVVVAYVLLARALE